MFTLILSFSGFAQNVGINSTGDQPNSAAGLDIDFTDKGLLIPRVSLIGTTSSSPLAAHVAGMVVYNTATTGDVKPGFYYDNGSRWIPGFLTGNSVGDMLYWDGAQWVMIPVGQPGEYLKISASNIPVWGGNSYAALTTNSISSITITTAACGGNITTNGGFAVVSRGVCWSTTPHPSIANSKTSDGSGNGAFTSSLTGLSSGTVYYVRAYAMNSSTISYGNEVSFTTLANLPTLASTTAATSITGTTAVSGGNVTSNGGATITERGVCYGTASNPTITNSKVIDASPGTGSFVSNLSGLTGGTLYYVRAYATNLMGTSYGTQISFTTTRVPPTLVTVAASNITGASATSGGSMSWNGGGYSNYQAYGVAYSTVSNSATPTKVATNSSIYSYTIPIAPWTTNLTGLAANTTYFIRSYLDVYGTGWVTVYGNELSFTTTGPTLPIVASTTAITGLSSNKANSGGAITSDGGSAITSKGVCWGNSPDPVLGSGNFTTNGTGTASFTSNITGLTASTTYYVRAYATNSVGTSYGPANVSFTTWIQAPYTVGENVGYGWCAYVAPDGSGFIVSPDISSTAGWGCNGVNVGTSTALGSGQANTTLILACSVGTTTAASVANDYTGGGYTDWYLPSSGEWAQIYTNYSLLGFSWSYNNYYTSSQYGTNYNYAATYFNTGSYAYASGANRVPGVNDYVSNLRVIRSFGPATLPTVSTDAISNIGGETATSGGNITNDGGANIIERGVCWSTVSEPTIADSKTSDGTGSGTYESSITDLTPGTLYYVRAYATNIAGTTYGIEESFTTIVPSAPTITTEAITNIIATGATSGGTIVSDGGATISLSGICWNTTGAPTIADDITTDGSTSGTFASNAIGLLTGTTYYLSAYATNSVGTSYGSELSFTTTSPSAPIITTEPIIAQTDVSGTSGGTIVSDGGDPITVSGICWNTTGNPTTDDPKTTDGTTNSTFYSDATGLTAGTTYFIRAYATNGIGTSYGNEITFTPVPAGAPIITTDPIYNLVGAMAVGGGNLVTDGGNGITEWGLCWSITPNPTIASNKVADNIYLSPGAANFYANLTGLTVGTTYHVRAYATNSVATTYGDDVTFTAAAATLGDIIYTGNYTAIVYSVDGTGTHGLLTMPNSYGWATDWGCSPSTVGTSTALGSGEANTTAIVSDIINTPCESTNGPGNFAAEQAVNGGGWLGTGWYLPSKDELDLLYTNSIIYGIDFSWGDIAPIFWSSSEDTDTNAWYIDGSDGTWHSVPKTDMIDFFMIMSF